MPQLIPPAAGVPAAWLDEARASLRLSSQLLLSQFSIMLMPLMDLITLAPLGAHTVAAAGLVNSLTALLLLFCFGVMQALAPLAGAAIGTSGGLPQARGILAQALVLSTVIGLLGSLLLHGSLFALPALGQDPAVVRQATAYAQPLSWALLPGAWLCAWRVGLPVLGHAQRLARVLLACALLHGLTNAVLVHGWRALPELGIQGIGWSYVLTYSIAAVLLAWHDWRAPWQVPSWSELGPGLVRLLGIGLPIGAVMAIEYTLFSGATLLMGQFGSLALASHAICLQWVTLTFIIPLAMSNTLLTRLSLAIGRANAGEVRRMVVVACGLAATFHVAVAGCCLLLPARMAQWLLPTTGADHEALLRLAVPMLQLAGVLQAFNGMSVVLAAVLRACQDTRAPLLQVFAGYWIAGLGSAWLLTFVIGPIGIWLGMCLGFSLTFAVLLQRTRHRLDQFADLFPQPESADAQPR